MNTNPNPVPPNPMYEAAFRRMRQRRKLVRRAGCLVMFLAWLVVMLLPCAFLTLLVEKELTYTHSDLPEHQYRLFLLDSPDQRGVGLASGSIESGGADEAEACVMTSVRYFLWEGEGDNLSYCSCYEKMGEEWSATLVGGDKNCQPVPLATEEP